MNINIQILELALSMGLSAMSTGGGCDFVVKSLKGVDLVLSDETMESPKSLLQRGVVSIYRTDEDGAWGEQPVAVLTFYTVRQAMTFMQNTLTINLTT